MRVGILNFGEPVAEVTNAADELRARDFDVVVEAGEPTTIREEAKRLHRADCDGVLFTLGDGAQVDDVAEAALYITCAILLIAPFSTPVQAEAANLLSSVTVTFDAMFTPEATVERISEWLYEISKTERQRGVEAAHKLYGTRLLVPDQARASMAVRGEWLLRFGILLSSETNPGETRPDDMHVPDGAMAAALTERLLRLVSGSEEVQSVAAQQFVTEETPLSSDSVTIAQIEWFPESGFRFSSRVFHAGRCATKTGSIVGGTHDPLNTDRAGNYPHCFYAAQGNHVGAWRAACDTLDIAVDVLRSEA